MLNSSSARMLLLIIVASCSICFSQGESDNVSDELRAVMNKSNNEEKISVLLSFDGKREWSQTELQFREQVGEVDGVHDGSPG